MTATQLTKSNPIDTPLKLSTIEKSPPMPQMLKPRKSRPEPANPNRTYSSVEVSTLASVSLRQLQWWDERKVVSPRHEGHRRVYFPAEVIEITVIAELRRKGFSLRKSAACSASCKRNGQAARRPHPGWFGPPPGHGRKGHLPRRPPRTHYRPAQERSPAHVPGLRQRSGPAPGRSRTQARAPRKRLSSPLPRHESGAMVHSADPTPVNYLVTQPGLMIRDQ